MADRIEFTMDAGQRDYRCVGRNVYLTSVRGRVFIVLSVLCFALSACLAFWAKSSWVSNLSAVLMVLLAVIAQLPFAFIKRQARSINEAQKYLHNLMYFMDGEGFGWKADETFTSTKWRRFKSFRETPKYIFLDYKGYGTFTIFKYLLPQSKVDEIRMLLGSVQFTDVPAADKSHRITNYGILIAGIVFFAGMVGTIPFLLFQYSNSFLRMKAPGVKEVKLDKGSYKLFHEYLSDYEGAVYDCNEAVAGAYQYAIRTTDGSPVEMYPTEVDEYSFCNKRKGKAFRSFDIQKDGKYIIEVKPSKPDSSGAIVVSVAPTFGKQLKLILSRLVMYAAAVITVCVAIVWISIVRKLLANMLR